MYGNWIPPKINIGQTRYALSLCKKNYIFKINRRPFKIKIKKKKFQLRRILSFYEADFSCDHFFFYFIIQGDITFNFLSFDILILEWSSIFGKFS